MCAKLRPCECGEGSHRLCHGRVPATALSHRPSSHRSHGTPFTNSLSVTPHAETCVDMLQLTDTFNLHGVHATTMGATPCLIVNGKRARVWIDGEMEYD